ncbi:hypothetical protein P8452_75267 [Trifolium repens]|nr:hypothetical protein P8452_75267 [Trifolium repens]
MRGARRNGTNRTSRRKRENKITNHREIPTHHSQPPSRATLSLSGRPHRSRSLSLSPAAALSLVNESGSRIAIRESYPESVGLAHFRKCGLLILCVKHAKVARLKRLYDLWQENYDIGFVLMKIQKGNRIRRFKRWENYLESVSLAHFRRCNLLILRVKRAKVFHGQPMHTNVPAAPHPPAMRPRLRRERIAERIRALQDLVPSVNKIEKLSLDK